MALIFTKQVKRAHKAMVEDIIKRVRNFADKVLTTDIMDVYYL